MIEAPPVGAGRRSARLTAGLGRRVSVGLRHAVAIGAVVVFVLPLVWMLSTSLKSPREALIFPPVWLPASLQFENYRAAWVAVPFGRYMLNSILAASLTVLLQAITVTTAAYAFAQLRFRFREPIFVLFLTAMMIPIPVTIVPTFLLLSALGWINTYLALSVPFGASAFGVFLLRQTFLSIPADLVDAAKIDGASHLQILRRVMIPLGQPTLMTFLLLSFTWRWNEYLWPLIVTTSPTMRTLPVGLVLLRANEGHTQWHVLMAATVLTIAPIVLLFSVTQRQFVEGIARGGIKG
jgi:sn-glycerol 3-phosphate transport system permease protein